VAVIARGRIVAEGPPSTLGGRAAAATVIRFGVPSHADDLPEVARDARQVAGRFELATTEPTHVLHDLTSWAVSRGIELEGLEVLRPSLEDIYLELTGGEAGAE
jgi:ABC-2 type transport system ATP-binding protein